MLKTKDKDLIKHLNEDSWKKNTALANELGITRMTLLNRIKKLIDNEILLKYTIMVNPYLYSKKVFYEIKTNPREPEVLDTLRKLQFEALEGIIGDYSLIIKQNFWKDQDFLHNLNTMDQLNVENYRLIEIFRTYKEHGQIFLEKQQSQMKLGDLDVKILQGLKNQGKGRGNTSELAKRIGIPQSTIYKKINDFRKKNLIKFNISINPLVLDYKIKFYMRIKVEPGCIERVVNGIREHPQVTDLFRTGENYGLLSIIRARTIDEFNIIINELYEKNPISDTRTTLVLNGLHDNYFFPSTLIQ
ncbi:MAG: Lrp/AsnC family transcriptional regulator [Candidatus Helarchaeota archaeon]